MKTPILSLILFIALNPLLADESLFNLPEEQNSSKKEQNSSKQVKKDKQAKNKQDKNLNQLFNSKFPVSDYIYEAGFREPDEDEAIRKVEAMVKDESKVFEKDTPSTPPPAVVDDNKTKMLETQNRIKELKSQNQDLQGSINYDENAKIKKLLRDSLLASRNSEVRNFQTNNKYGEDGFSNQKSIDTSTNEHRLFRMIRAGKLIPATLTTAISSDLAGIVTAQVEQDIYASMGKAVLIPRGSKAIGFYTNDNKIGQNRLEIKWREIITPQGINILLTDAIVSDNMGMMGAIGSLNNKYFERYGIAIGINTLSNALLLSIASKVDSGGNAYAQELYSGAKSDVSTIVDDIIQQQSQIKPTIEIKAGSRIYIVPTNHMWFSKPKNNEVLMKYFIE